MKHKKAEVEVVVFDLNGTFYNKSSKEEFYKFILSKRPGRIRYIWGMMYYYVLLKLHGIKQTEFKENFFNYLNDFSPDQVTTFAREFWEQEFSKNFHEELLKRFDLFRKDEQVILFCATGGLEIYVKPLFEIYKINGFAGTRVSYIHKTYEVDGRACKGKEKIARLEEYLNGRPYRIIEAYSDSKEEILDEAERAFLLKDGKILPYHSSES